MNCMDVLFDVMICFQTEEGEDSETRGFTVAILVVATATLFPYCSATCTEQHAFCRDANQQKSAILVVHVEFCT